MTNLIGRSLGRYQILEQLGEGGMAVVYKAYDTRLERNVAIKVILPGREHSEKFLIRFEREAKSLAGLSHPNIIKVIDYGDHEGLPYLVMEYIPGGTLKYKIAGKSIPCEQTAQILLPLAKALAYAHENNIIHRDIKPANILITQSGDPMLSDFGIAKILEVEETFELTATGVGIGTPEYMSPEQAQGKPVDARSDVYSLGVVMYEMVTGRKPYQADTPMAVVWKLASEPLPRPKSLNAELPDHVDQILLKALAKNPEDRYQNMGEFISALEKILSSIPSRTGLVESRKGLSTAGNRRLVILTLAAIAILALTGIFITWLINRNVDGIQPKHPVSISTGSPEKTSIPTEILECETVGDCVTVMPDRVVYKIIVEANKKWSDTGILVRKGDLIHITNISGKWRSSPDYSWVDGTECANSCVDCLLTTTSEGSLVAKIGDGKAFCGASSSIQSEATGILFLSFNDCPSSTSCFSDNEGSLGMQVEVMSDESSSVPSQEDTFLVLEDFEDGKIQMIGYSTDSDRWKVVEDADGNKVFAVDNRNGDKYVSFSIGEDNWGDYVTEYRVKLLNDASDVGLQVRSNTTTSYYVIDFSLSFLYLAYPSPTEWVRITTKYPPIQTDIWHTIKISVQGNEIQVFVDDFRWIDEHDTRFSKGSLLFFASPGAYAQVDDIKVLDLGK